VKLPAFSSLLAAHRDDLYRFLIAAVGRDEADDCFQETVLSALGAYPKLGSDRNLRGWLFTIAHRKAVDAHRGRRRRPVPVERFPEPPVEAAESPDSGMWKAVSLLPEGQRQAVQLRFWGDASYADVSLALGCSPAAARKRVSEALSRLREVLSK
jgi:RNA polymerase sigma factor (sigma-70 family)